MDFNKGYDMPLEDLISEFEETIERLRGSQDKSDLSFIPRFSRLLRFRFGFDGEEFNQEMFERVLVCFKEGYELAKETEYSACGGRLQLLIDHVQNNCLNFNVPSNILQYASEMPDLR